MPKNKNPLKQFADGSVRWFNQRSTDLLPLGILLIAVATNLYLLAPEVRINPQSLNDNVFHLMNLKRTVQALEDGRDPTDFWLAPVGLGYPLFHHYQHFSYLPLAWIQHISGGMFSLQSLMNWTNYLLLSLFPLSIYYGMQQFKFSRLESALAGIAAPLVSTANLFGIDYASYIWRGSGLYTQLWAMLFLPLALGRGNTTLRTGRGYFWTVITLVATLLSHLVTGYIAGFSLVVMAVFGSSKREELPRRLGRLTLIAITSVLTASYFLLPFWLDRAYMNRSIWEGAEKYNSYGHEWVLSALFRGDIFDFGRFPSLTLLAGIGLVVCLLKWQKTRYRIPVLIGLTWLMLFFGRSTWGVILDLLPFSKDMHFHRLSLGVHIGGIFLMGIGLNAIWTWSHNRSSNIPKIAAALFTIVLFLPVYAERLDYIKQNTTWIQENESALKVESADLNQLIAALQGLPPGRIYAGQGNNWGEQYRIGSIPLYVLLSQTDLDMLGFNFHALSFNSEITVHFNDTLQEQYDLFNVRYIVAPLDQPVPAFARRIGVYGRHVLYQVETSGYFDLVDNPVGFFGTKEDFYPIASTWLLSPLPAQKQHLSLMFQASNEEKEHLLPPTEAENILAELGSSNKINKDRGQIISEQAAEGHYQAEIDVYNESTLLIKTTYHPGWEITLNGKPVQSFMVIPSYLGIKVMPGSYQVEAEYKSSSLRQGLKFFGLAVLMLTGLLDWFRPQWENLLQEKRIDRIKSWCETTWTYFYTSLHAIGFSKRLRFHTPSLLALLILIVLAGLPAFQFQLLSGHDFGEYLPRSVEFYQGLKGGALFPQWAPDLSTGYGQPFFIFNPPMFYYLTSFAHEAGFTQVASQNIAILLVILLSAIGMYLVGSEFFGRKGGLVVSAAYLFSPYFLSVLYVRHALADFTAFAFIPFTLWGLYRYAIDGTTRHLLVGSVSLTALILSANPISLISMPAFLLMIVGLAIQKRAWQILLRGLWCMVLGITLAAFFWLPALVEMKFTKLHLLKEGYLNYANHFVYPGQLLYSPWGYGLSIEGPQDGMSFSIGLVHLLVAISAIILINRIYKQSQKGFFIISFSLITLLVAVFAASTPSEFLWERISLLQNLEFPWRILSLVSISTALLFGFPFLLVPKTEKRNSKWVAIALISTLFFTNFPKAKPESTMNVKDNDFSAQKIAEERLAVTTAREYQPIWVEGLPQKSPVTDISLIEGEAHTFTSRVTPTLIIGQINVNQEARFQANVNYFPGWTLMVDGEKQEINISYPEGLIEFELSPGEHFIELSFGLTPIRMTSRVLSLLACGGLLGTNRVKKTRKKNRNEEG